MVFRPRKIFGTFETGPWVMLYYVAVLHHVMPIKVLSYYHVALFWQILAVTLSCNAFLEDFLTLLCNATLIGSVTLLGYAIFRFLSRSWSRYLGKFFHTIMSLKFGVLVSHYQPVWLVSHTIIKRYNEEEFFSHC